MKSQYLCPETQVFVLNRRFQHKNYSLTTKVSLKKKQPVFLQAAYEHSVNYLSNQAVFSVSPEHRQQSVRCRPYRR